MKSHAMGTLAWTDGAIILFWRGPCFFRMGPDPTAETYAAPTPDDLTRFSRGMDRAISCIGDF